MRRQEAREEEFDIPRAPNIIFQSVQNAERVSEKIMSFSNTDFIISFLLIFSQILSKTLFERKEL